MSSLENNNTTKISTTVDTSEKPTGTIDATTLAERKTDINTTKTKTKTNLGKLHQKTLETHPLSNTLEKKNFNPENNTSKKAIDTIGDLATFAGADEKNVKKITEIINEDSAIGKFVSKTWSAIKPFIPKFILDLFATPDHGIGDDTGTTTPSNITPKGIDETYNTKLDNIEIQTPPNKITEAIKQKLTLKTKSTITRMFEGSISPPMKEKFILPNNTTYKNLQAELKLKSRETIHGGDTEQSPTHKGTYILMKLLENEFPTILKHSAAVNDDFHHDKIQYHSKHQDGVAFDYTLNGGGKNFHLSAYPKIKNFFQDLGIDTSGFINEYAKLSKHGTAGHLHFQFKEKDLDAVYNAFSQA